MAVGRLVDAGMAVGRLVDAGMAVGGLVGAGMAVGGLVGAGVALATGALVGVCNVGRPAHAASADRTSAPKAMRAVRRIIVGHTVREFIDVSRKYL
jgi:hypothetical protein